MDKHADQSKIYAITDLAPQEKRPWRTSIFINGEFWRGYDTDTILELGLYKGQRLTAEELEKIDHSLDKRRAVNRAVLLLSYRGRSVREVTDRLTRAGFSTEIVAEAVDDLTRLGYLNDEDFAQSWMKSRMTSKRYGSRRIKQELKLKGVSDEIIAQKLEEHTSDEDEYERAHELALSKATTYKGLASDAALRRLSQFLMRRGYSPSVAYGVSRDVLRGSGACGNGDSPHHD